MSHTSSNDDSAQTVLPATAADADAAVTSGADVSSSDAATTELHSASVSLKFTPAAPVMSSSSEEEEEEEEDEDEADSDADAGSDNEADSHDESDNGAASGDEAGDTTAAGVQESGEEGAAGKQESDLPDVGSLLNSINRRNASFRGRQQKDKEFRVKLIALDPDIHRRKRKLKTSSDFFKKNVTHVETPNLGQMLKSKYRSYAERQDEKRRKENELGLTQQKWKNADWNFAPTGAGKPDNKRDYR